MIFKKGQLMKAFLFLITVSSFFLLSSPAKAGDIRAKNKYGSIIGHVEADGTVRAKNKYGSQIGFVESDGTVRAKNKYGTVVGHVESPRILASGAALLLLIL